MNGYQFDEIQLAWEPAGRKAAVAVSRFRPDPGPNQQAALANRLEEVASFLREGSLTGVQAIEQVLWGCAGYLQGTQLPPAVIDVGARVIPDEGVPTHQVSEDEDPDEQGL